MFALCYRNILIQLHNYCFNFVPKHRGGGVGVHMYVVHKKIFSLVMVYRIILGMTNIGNKYFIVRVKSNVFFLFRFSETKISIVELFGNLTKTIAKVYQSNASHHYIEVVRCSPHWPL